MIYSQKSYKSYEGKNITLENMRRMDHNKTGCKAFAWCRMRSSGKLKDDSTLWKLILF
jgi:hypothetical protein